MKRSLIKTINHTLDQALERDEKIVVFGQDVGFFGGVFRCTDGLQEKYGKQRVFDSPINEAAIVAMAMGMAINGLRPVAEIQFADYIFPGFDQILSELTRIRYRSAASFTAPVTLRTPCGGGIFGGQTHSMSPEAFFTHMPGLYVVMPSNPVDAKGLLHSAIETDDPVLFFEPKRLYNGPFHGDHDEKPQGWNTHPLGEVEDAFYRIPLSSACTRRPGTDVSILSYGTMVHVALAAAEAAAKDATPIDAEVIDLRTIWPVDRDHIVESVCRTGRCIILHEAPRTSGFGAELASLVQEHAFWNLESPILRVTGWDTPYPHAHEWSYFPTCARVKKALLAVMQE